MIFHLNFGTVPTLRYFFIFHFVTDRKLSENDMLSNNRSVKRIHTQQVLDDNPDTCPLTSHCHGQFTQTLYFTEDKHFIW